MYHRIGVVMMPRQMQGLLRTEEDVRRRLEDEFKRPIPQHMWQYLLELRAIEDYLLNPDEDTWENVKWHCRQLFTVMSYGKREEERLKRPREAPPDKRLAALGEIWAAEARREVGVMEFREKVLGGRLLTWEEASAWIKRQAQEQGRPTSWVRVPLPDGYRPDTLRGLHWLEAFADLPDSVKATWPVARSTEALAYLADDEWVREVPVARSGVLGRLKALATRLTKRFPLWDEAQAVMFVLTDTAPRLSKARIRTALPSEGPPRIMLEVDARTSPDEVARFYAPARKEVLSDAGAPAKDKPMTEKHLHLAVYLAEHFETPWSRLMEAWNAEYPAWAYSDMRTFARDAKAAWCRVTGRKWAPRRGGRKERTQHAEEES